MTFRLLISAGLLLGLPALSISRTWYVAADGSGDAPTIEAAVDSSDANDVILVGSGTFDIGVEEIALQLKPNTSLISEGGPALTFLQPGGGIAQPLTLGLTDSCELGGFTVRKAGLSTISAYGDGIEIHDSIIESSLQGIVTDGAASIHHNLILGGGVAITIYDPSPGVTVINNNIIIGQIDRCDGNVFISCNDVTVPSNCIQYGGSNFNLDPLFCRTGSYYLTEASPCAPGNHPNGNNCGLLGPLPVGCGTVTVRETSWGAIKILYDRR